MRRLFAYLGILFLLLVWSAGTWIAGAYIVPPPWTAALDTLLLLARQDTWLQILITLGRVAAGFLAAFISGAVLGFLAGSSRRLDALFKPLILVFQGVPPILWSIPLILVFGIGHLAPVLVIALICFPLVALNVSEGMQTIRRDLEEMLAVFAPGLYPRLRELILPHLQPFLTASLKLGIVLGIKASAVAEYFGANDGIGFQIQAAYQSFLIRRLFAWGLLLILLITLADRLLALAEKTLPGIRKGLRFQGQVFCDLAALEAMKRRFRGAEGGTLVLEGVSFQYPHGPQVLEKVDLKVGPRQVAVISGESGIGKTTLLFLAAGLLRPLSGRIDRPQRLGIAFQDDRLLPYRSNAWNLAIPLFYSGTRAHDALCFASYLLQEVGLGELENDLPLELSGGMKKRLSFARSFARFPEAILLDEPFTGLHREARRHLWAKFFDLLELHRVPVVIVTHFPEEIPKIESSRYYVLREGTRSIAKSAGGRRQRDQPSCQGPAALYPDDRFN